jgi:hypothetical protein
LLHFINLDPIGIVDLPAIMKQLHVSPDIAEVQRSLVRASDMLAVSGQISFGDMHYPRFQETLLDRDFMMTFHTTSPIDWVNEFLKRWITKHENPTWEALADLIRALGAYHAAQKIRAIIPTIRPPASEHAALKKSD